MNQLKFKIDGTSYTLKADGTYDSDKGNGKWTSDSTTNKLKLSQDGSVKEVAVTYVFETSNKKKIENLLKVSVPSATDKDTAFAYFGGTIKIGKDKHISYVLGDGSITFAIHGELSFSTTYDELVITFGEKEKTSIFGTARLDESDSDDGDEKDLLAFATLTSWEMDGETGSNLAEIEFLGGLSLDENNNIIFLGSYKGGKTFDLTLVGKYKLGTAGLRIFSNDDDSGVVLRTQGGFDYKGSKGEWEIGLGYSAKESMTMKAALEFEKNFTDEKGKAKIKTKAEISYGNKGFEAELEIEGHFEIGEDGMLTFDVVASMVAGKTKFAFGAELVYAKNGRKFSVDLKHDGKTTSLGLMYETKKLNSALKILKNGNTGEFSFMVEFTIGGDNKLNSSGVKEIPDENAAALSTTLPKEMSMLLGPVVTESSYPARLAKVARGQYDEYHDYTEDDAKLTKQIKKYWEEIGFDFPGVDTAWSAVFVCWCVRMAGATPEEFKASMSHARFVSRAIKNQNDGTGLFRGRKLDEYKPKVGDIIHNNRKGHTYDYSFASSHESYESHSAVVVEVGDGYVRTIGGNEGNTVATAKVETTGGGFVKQRKKNPYICVIENLKV